MYDKKRKLSSLPIKFIMLKLYGREYGYELYVCTLWGSFNKYFLYNKILFASSYSNSSIYKNCRTEWNWAKLYSIDLYPILRSVWNSHNWNSRMWSCNIIACISTLNPILFCLSIILFNLWVICVEDFCPNLLYIPYQFLSSHNAWWVRVSEFPLIY